MWVFPLLTIVVIFHFDCFSMDSWFLLSSIFSFHLDVMVVFCFTSGALELLCRWSSRCFAPGAPQEGNHLPLWQHQHWAAQVLREPSLPYPARVVISGVLRLRWMVFAGLHSGELQHRGWYSLIFFFTLFLLLSVCFSMLECRYCSRGSVKDRESST